MPETETRTGAQALPYVQSANSGSDGHGDHPGVRGLDIRLKDIRKQRRLRVLSEADWQHWVTKGYVVVRGAVPQDLVDNVIAMLWEFQAMDPADPATWDKPQLREHRMKELNNAGMVEVYNHQSLWDTRQHPRVYDAFVDIWDREDLWVAIDRANLSPPNRRARENGRTEGFIHFDVDCSQRPLPVSVQGVLSLKRQGGEIGGFQAVPTIWAQIDTWWDHQPTGSDPFKPDVTGHDIINIDMEPGDLLIFDALQPHGVRPNVSTDKVRMAQYISMFPADPDNERLRRERIRLWQEQTHPIGEPFPGDPREFEKQHYQVAELNPLGRKLLGLDRWD